MGGSQGSAVHGPAWAAVLVLALAAAAVGAQSGAPAYSVAFVCPQGVDNNDRVTETVRVTCPYRIYDEDDALGSPTLVVDPTAARNVAVASLHGGGDAQGQTPRSRGNTGSGLFTVFTSTDAGYNWQDQPSWTAYPPQHVPGAPANGEHLTAAIDYAGRVYGAAVYSTRDASTDPWGNRMLLWKWRDIAQEIEWGRASKPVATLAWPVTVTDASLTYLPSRDSPLFHEPPYDRPGGHRLANETEAPAPSGDAPAAEREWTVATWLESAARPGVDLAGKASRVRAAWTGTDDDERWDTLATNMSVGPCSSVSNGVAWDGAVYVACVVADAKAYNHRSRVHEGDVDLWRIDPARDAAEFVSTASIVGAAHLKLAASSDGRFVLAAVDRLAGGRVRLDLAFGWFGAHWNPLTGLGDLVRTTNEPLVDVRIQALDYERTTRLVHLVYQEVYPPVESSLAKQNPLAPHATQFYKSLVSINECTGLLAAPLDLRVGYVRTYTPSFDPSLNVRPNTNLTLFDDLVDGLTLVPDAEKGQREFIGFGDLGTINFAEVVSRDVPACEPQGPGFAPGPGGPAQPAAAQTLAHQANMVGVAVVGSALAASMVLGLLRSVRRARVEAPSAGGKK